MGDSIKHGPCGLISWFPKTNHKTANSMHWLSQASGMPMGYNNEKYPNLRYFIYNKVLRSELRRRRMTRYVFGVRHAVREFCRHAVTNFNITTLCYPAWLLRDFLQAKLDRLWCIFIPCLEWFCGSACAMSESCLHLSHSTILECHGVKREAQNRS